MHHCLIVLVAVSSPFFVDIISSDPYVIVQDGAKRLHKTEVISKSLNPVWTLSTGSFFLISEKLNNFFENAARLEFVVRDYDSVGENNLLGSCLIKKSDLLKANGERVEYPLTLVGKAEKEVLVGKYKVRGMHRFPFYMTTLVYVHKV